MTHLPRSRAKSKDSGNVNWGRKGEGGRKKGEGTGRLCPEKVEASWARCNHQIRSQYNCDREISYQFVPKVNRSVGTMAVTPVAIFETVAPGPSQ
jgi:hypothetical protein